MNNIPKNGKGLFIGQFLTDCKGEKFFDVNFGEITLHNIINGKYEFSDLNGKVFRCDDSTFNILYPSGSASLYPSRELFEKYPLNAVTAWNEWKSKRGGNWWKPKPNEMYYYLDRRFFIKTAYRQVVGNSFDYTNFLNGNCFKTEEIAEQAQTTLKACLCDFHQNHFES